MSTNSPVTESKMDPANGREAVEVTTPPAWAVGAKGRVVKMSARVVRVAKIGRSMCFSFTF
jgi:hypothetical protein